MTNNVLWRNIDRGVYAGDDIGTYFPVYYTEYTGITLQVTFIIFWVVMGLHLIANFLLKSFTAPDFNEDIKINKVQTVIFDR